ncbi:hypothetical protein PMI21_00033 [Pseudomonas sp. GM18]|uniref:hypothetical protein n=1 Tax=Pseudomonas sp. GM18 TaxID=1144324 RepID=UPI0002727088|nr:hypothetical protein [Pseudomonas sp. GM18]EJM22222.1 hypothetical protein PMI21_00033 [Pseudomonas sp. GM18]
MSNITFPDAFNGSIICRSNPINGIRVKLEPLTGVQIGAVLKLSWLGFSDDAGTSPIPDTETSLNHFVTKSDIADGVEKTIGDYFQHIKPIRNGSARASYTINGGSPTFADIRVRLVNAVGETCDEIGGQR